jgi:glycosyltransferase involved in cell wall biosynthesis
MRIVYVSQYFPPEMGAPAARVSELSREWVRNGHQVTVVTGFANHPTGIKSPKDRWKVTRRESLDGIDVLRCYIWATPNKGIVKRMISYAIFMISAVIIASLRIERPDVVIATSPQLLCGLAGFILAKRFGVPFVLEVRDLWPESILAVDAMKENLIVRTLKRLAAFLYEQASVIVTVGKGYAKEIHNRYHVPMHRMRVIPNGIDMDLFVPGDRENAIRGEFDWRDRFVVLYVGTHGMAHALHVVLDAAERLQEHSEILFAFVGEGAEKERLVESARDRNLRNVQFIEQQPRSRVPLFYAACDVGLVSLRNTSLFQSVLPSKIFEYLGMERPILISVDGEARMLLEEAGAGWYVPPEDSPALARAVLEALDKRDELKKRGEQGRAYVLQHYNRKALAAEYLRLIETTRDLPEFGFASANP